MHPTITELLPALAARRGHEPRERQVLHLLVDGRAGKQIACELDVTLRTVDYRLRQIYRKAGVASREDLFARLAT